jgi:phosphate transport system substrate-binding protein
MMKKSILIGVFCFLAITILTIYSCDQNAKNKNVQTILKGKVTILVDETILPIIEDQVAVFQTQYNAEITLVGKSESEIVQLLSKGKNNLAILTRDLTKSESNFFDEKKITPKITPLATDAIAFISNKSNQDIQINLQDIVSFMNGTDQSKFSGVVFDNPNSSTVRYMKELAKIKDLPKGKIFSFKTNNEVIDFVSKNKGMIGVVGVNWLMEPLPEMQETIENVSVLTVKSIKDNIFVKPTQSDIADGLYPMTRQIKMLNFQGTPGLGMGFASFIAGEIGQRIILKSGLVPVRLPSRNIIIHKGIEKVSN